jgi:YARHG domain-containing protein
LSFTASWSNDGSFKAAGNHLIPMYETDISVKKEILTINRISADKASITVYYEFFNPKAPKEIEVGFEAVSPSGDVRTRPLDGHQPYINKFTVNMNGQSIPFKVAIVSDSLYYNNGKYKSKTIAEANKESYENDMVDWMYVYHFRAQFKPGINIIIHTYVVDLSGSVFENYSLDYILTAAGRWANRQIDDFTLQINMGEYQDVSIQNTFFSKAAEWKMPEATKSIAIKKEEVEGAAMTEFFIRKGMLVFQKQNFKPIGQLYIRSLNFFYYNGSNEDNQFNSKRDRLPFTIEEQDRIDKPADELSKRVLKNLPFARRGYIFKSPELQSYFEKQPWYKKDEKYKAVLAELTQKEQVWLNKL